MHPESDSADACASALRAQRETARCCSFPCDASPDGILPHRASRSYRSGLGNLEDYRLSTSLPDVHALRSMIQDNPGRIYNKKSFGIYFLVRNVVTSCRDILKYSHKEFCFLAPSRCCIVSKSLGSINGFFDLDSEQSSAIAGFDCTGASIP